MKLKHTWNRLVTKPDGQYGSPKPRSSHGLSLVDGYLVLYGGEHVARHPLTEEAGWILNLADLTWSRLPTDGVTPPSRLAHAQCVHDGSVYIFGGRAGVDMSEAAMNDLWRLDLSTKTWSQVETKGDAPEPRSFHRIACVGDSLFVFGGCGAQGRLADLYRLDMATLTWENIGPSQLRGRGGANLIVLNNKLSVVAGFAGEESADGQCYDPTSKSWEEATELTSKLTGMRPRSVCVSAAMPASGAAVIFGGEVDPSEKGHEGAGAFANDLVVLDYETGAYQHTIPPSATSPEARGWSAGAGDGSSTLYMFGGLAGDDESPRRLDDLWRLEVQN